MIPFQTPDVRDVTWVRPLLESEGLALCDYSFPVLFCWKDAYGFQYAPLGKRLLIRLRSHGAEQIVGFPPLQFAPCDIHGVEHFLERRHLDCQFVGHPLALRLVAFELLVPEGRPFHVKCNAQSVGRFFLQQFQQNI